MRLYFLFILFFICSSRLTAQISLSGKVYSLQGKALDQVNVQLLSLPDSSIFMERKTTEDGAFSFNLNKAGDYTLRYSHIGYETLLSKNYRLLSGDKATAIPAMLIHQSVELEAISVRGKAPAVRQYIDKMVVDVAESVVSEGNNVLELLEKTPGIVSDGKGNFSIQGRTGAKVKIDGRDIYLSGAQLAALLRGMQASDIAKLELMANPSSKEDASGTAGSINIVTKRNRRLGFGGDVFARAGQARKPEGSMGGGFHFKNDRLNTFVNASVGREESKQHSVTENRFYSNGELARVQTQKEETRLDPGRYHSLRTGATFEIDTNTTLEASINWIKGTFISNSVVDTRTETVGVTTDARTSNTFDEGYNNLTFNVNYNKKYAGDEHFLKVNLDYAPHTNKYDNMYRTQFLDGTGAVERISARKNVQDLSNTTYTARMDYSKPYTNSKLELGYKFTHFFIDNSVQNDTLVHDKWALDNNSSNNFQYTQHVQAAYFIYSGKSGKFEYQAGLRGEYAYIETVQKTLGKKNRNNYMDLFPNAFALYNFNSNNFLRTSFGSRIERPGDHDVNVFRVYENAFSYYEGNADLESERSYTVEVGHGFKNKLFTTLSSSYGKNVITWITRAAKDENVTFSTPENIGRFINYSASVMYNSSFVSWWSGSHYVNVFHNEYIGEVDAIDLDSKGSSWSFNSKHTLQLKWGIRSEVLGYYNSGVTTGVQRKEATYGVDFGVEKKLLGDRTMIKLAVNGLIRNGNPRLTSRYDNLVLSHSSYPDNRKVLLSLSYRFGA
ncbi:outer membrane beta-barrel family protein [Sphingobacterium faecale]|uniref:TonB-dependent receptor n=1 Tax=Sphingobacterium faecale TaxID=2803775 RepID=A0ABS1R7R4_9SPHI|nr:outer membrane beta-barrel family protein [Sphingobacterium faecale]MBL1410766.1 TonB-dependent receptor [Sphingobacterium faecale]